MKFTIEIETKAEEVKGASLERLLVAAIAEFKSKNFEKRSKEEGDWEFMNYKGQEAGEPVTIRFHSAQL